jgi:hypothetical protein
MAARHLLRLARRGLTRASSARMPPSPRLSARMIRIAYLIEMKMISDQKISDTMPTTASGETCPSGLADLAATLRV